MITKIIPEEKIQKAKKYVEKGDKFVIVTHVSPDGDALGSSLGLYHFLNACGKDSVAVVVPNDFPQFYRWMPGAKDIVIHEKYPDREIKIANAEGLRECRKLLTMAKAGKYNGYLLEGMACPGGCVAGAGTMQPIKKSQTAVNKYAAQAKHKISSQTEYVKELDKLVD